MAAFLQCISGGSESTVPENLTPPGDVKLAFIGHATGFQIYRCRAPEPGGNSQGVWVLSAPEAILTDDGGKEIATHFVGPTWQAMDGSQVQGKALAQALPDPESIPWLLITAIEHKGNGVMNPIAYIQRLHTKGGKAPTGGCDASDTDKKVRIPYTADYYFYSAAPAPAVFQLTSPAFKDGDAIPPPYACDGMNMSPPLSWTDPPAGTQSLALIVTDPDAPAGTFVHWVVYNMPASERSLPKAYKRLTRQSDGTLQGINEFGKVGYGGPCPGTENTHRYRFTLYALDARLPDKIGYSAGELGSAMNGHILAKTQLIGTYRRHF